MNIFASLKNTLATRLSALVPSRIIPSRLIPSNGITDTVPVYAGARRKQAFALQQRRRYRMDFGQAELKKAIDMAEDHVQPRRELLITIYREVMRDLHLKSQIRTANNKVIDEPWAIVKKGTSDIDKDRTELLQKVWFEQFRRHCLDAEFWGHSLIQFEAMAENTDDQTKQYAAFVFDRVGLIPRENVEPKKGLLLIWPGDVTGIPYRDTLLGDWLLEAGDPDNIGLLADCARYSIFKKFGLSDWSRSGEKWGDPLLVIRSSSNDDAENAKKAEFAANFGNNGWAILDDDDQVDILERQNDKGYAIFMDFCKYVDDENSKGVNGQTGSSDQKSFVGAANVHERVLEAYTKERLRSEMYYINEKLLPFLIGKGYDLAGYAYRPLEFLRELTIPGTEPPPDPNADPNSDPNAKPKPGQEGPATPKKSLRFSPVAEALSLAYADCGHETCGHAANAGHDHGSDVQLSVGIDKLITEALRRLFDRKVKRGDVDAKSVKATTGELHRAVQQGWAKDIGKMPYASPEHLNYLQMRHNTAVTAIFKNHTHNLQVLAELFDQNGKVRTWPQFKKAALGISRMYNKDWLKTEFQTAQASARMALKWQDFAKRPDGKITYKTVGDGRVREEHRVLDGVTKPVTDVFWDTFFPPNGWSCRCSVRWVPGNTPDVDASEIPPMPPLFRSNVGKTGEVFNGEHPYFDNAASLKPNRIKLPVSPERMAENVRLYRQYERDADYELAAADNLNGGFVFRHALADLSDLPGNTRVGRVLASEGNAVAIREHVVDGVSKNPELEVNGVISDLKTPTTASARKAGVNSFDSAARQRLSSFVMELTREKYDVSDLADGIRQGFFNKAKIERVMVLWEGKILDITRLDYTSRRIGYLIAEFMRS